ncbi:MAG: Txe/YoeB family addiction module toxin [Brumimicrobium sp.]|nr:Txe/YoeB family addiction module toxin [Brumimicrobium sp.]MCO5268512.1 Txe/YoeB family addiction module toxin [Brumimicrobium sp.]
MGQYKIEYTSTALDDLSKHKKVGNKTTMNKIQRFIEELKVHPETGTGKVEQLTGNLTGFWSRRINSKDRLVYKIEKHIVTVVIISAIGHYGDK